MASSRHADEARRLGTAIVVEALTGSRVVPLQYRWQQEQRPPSAAPAPRPDVATARSREECAVCLEFVEKGQEFKVLPCFHIFHAECVRRWEKRDCPVCRRDA